MKTINDIRTERQLSAPKHVTTKRELTFNNSLETACVIPAGTSLEVYFSGVRHDRIYFEYNGSARAASIVNAHNSFTGFNKPPGMAALERYSNDGVAKTCTGHRTEPDGTGPDGSPSWLLVIGVI